jgi:hypothetical protein
MTPSNPKEIELMRPRRRITADASTAARRCAPGVTTGRDNKPSTRSLNRRRKASFYG